MALSAAMQTTLERHKDHIALLEQQNEWFASGKMDIGDIGPGGELISTKDEAIQHNKEVISQLRKVVDAILGSDGDRDKLIDLLIS